MPSKRITRIEFPVKLPAPAQPQPRKRVAAYARVSTMKDAQENSLQSQQDYFAEYNGNLLAFTLKGGTGVVKRWQDRSRAESWTAEMRKTAGEKTRERNQRHAES